MKTIVLLATNSNLTRLKMILVSVNSNSQQLETVLIGIIHSRRPHKGEEVGPKWTVVDRGGGQQQSGRPQLGPIISKLMLVKYVQYFVLTHATVKSHAIISIKIIINATNPI